MDPATLVGIALALGALLTTMILEGSSPMAIVLIPHFGVWTARGAFAQPPHER